MALAFLAFSILTIAFLTLSPTLAGARESRWCLICGRQVVGDLLLNVALFVPLGVGLALLGTSRWRAFGIALLTTTTIELTQGFLLRGRFASVSDIVTNSTGALIGHALGSHWPLLLLPSARVARRLAGGTLLAWFAILAGAAWGLTPRLEPGDYRVVTLDDQQADDGTAFVKAVALLRTVGGAALIDARPAFDDALRRRELVLLARFRPISGNTPIPDDTLLAAVHRAGSPPAISILHAGGLLTVVVHTRARALRLHEPTIFWGPVGFLATTRDSLVTIAGGVDGDSIRLFALRGDEIIDRSSLGLAPAVWLYLLIGAAPGLKYLIPLAAFLNVALLAPAAYWAAFAIARSRHRGAKGAVGLFAALVLLVLLGFTGVPELTGLAPTPGLIWIACLVALGIAGFTGWQVASGRSRAAGRPEASPPALNASR